MRALCSINLKDKTTSAISRLDLCNIIAHLFSLESPMSQVLPETRPVLKAGIVDREIFESAQILGDLRRRHTQDALAFIDIN